MRPEHWRRLRTIWEAALELEPDERDPFLVDACAGDDELLREVRGMLASDDTSADSFLDTPLGAARAAGPEPGERVGSFRLERLLAAGGMGAVWEAWQDEPHRRVALKLLRRGLDDDSAVRRFRFEAELLGRLHHPGIAAVHEAGVHTGDDGAELPYIAMEYVEGARDIVAYADEEALELEARLELVCELCAAAQYGHQLGVVHRDLKPQNILVDPDGRVRVIDFGIARAVGADSGAPDLAAPETQLTGAGEILGTLAYMSPEQFAGDSSRIDTRSDVYALGVVLHELACGRRPFDLAGKSLIAIVRTVSEQAPTPPPELPDDLGWILCKALATDPDERYASASELAADLQRFLTDEPVEAGAPTRTYRLRKFVRRNRTPVAFAALAAAALVVGTMAAVAGLLEARAARDDFEDQRDVAVAEADKFEDMAGVLIGMLLSVSPEEDGRDVRVADVLDRASTELAATGDPEVQAALRRVMGLAYSNLGLRDEALAELEAGLALAEATPGADPQLVAQLREGVARVLIGHGRFSESVSVADVGLAEASARLDDDDPIAFQLVATRAAALARDGRADEVLAELPDEVARAEAVLGPDAEATRALRGEWARSLSTAGRDVEAVAVLDENVRRLTAFLGPLDPATLTARFNRAAALQSVGRRADGRAELEELLPAFEATFGRASARTCALMAKLAELVSNDGDFAAAYALLEQAVPCLESKLDPSSPSLIQARASFAALLDRMDDDAAALALRRGAWEAAERYYGADDLRALHHAHNAAILYERLGQPGEALAIAERVVPARRAALGDDDPATLEALEIQGKSLVSLGRLGEALPVVREVLDARTRIVGPDHPATLRVHTELSTTLAYLGRLDEALVEGERLLAAHRRALPEHDPARVILLNNLGGFAQGAGQFTTAVDYFAEARRLATAHLPPESIDRALATIGLGETHVIAGEPEAGLGPLREAVASLALRPGARPDQRGRAHGALGIALLRLERFDEARPELERALEFYDRIGDTARVARVREYLESIPPDAAED